MTESSAHKSENQSPTDVYLSRSFMSHGERAQKREECEDRNPIQLNVPLISPPYPSLSPPGSVRGDAKLQRTKTHYQKDKKKETKTHLLHQIIMHEQRFTLMIILLHRVSAEIAGRDTVGQTADADVAAWEGPAFAEGEHREPG